MAKAKKTTNTKKITVASVMKAIEISKNNKETMIIGDGENQVEIVVKKRLTLFERADMVNSIASMVWAEDEDGNDRFAPYLRKFAYDFNVLNYFTNISLPDDTDKIWEFVDTAEIVPMVIDFVGGGYIENILREANEVIEYRKNEILKRSKLDDVLDAVLKVAKTIDVNTKNLDMNGLFDIVQKNAPEFKEEFENFIKAQMNEVPTATSEITAV